MLGILVFLWRVVVPLLGLGTEALFAFAIAGIWRDSVNVPANLFLTSLLVAAMVLVALIVLLIEGQFSIVYRVAIPLFMGVLAVTVLFLLVGSISNTAAAEIDKSELFGSMKFYSIMLAVGIWIVVETLWIALIFIIQGIPGASLKTLIGGSSILGLALMVTFVYFIVSLLIYVFSNHYQIIFMAIGGVYLVFLVLYSIVKRRTISEIVTQNLDKYWRKAV